MTPPEFEEKSDEAPLYSQLERGQQVIFTPGQVLESLLGFDHDVFMTQAALWEGGLTTMSCRYAEAADLAMRETPTPCVTSQSASFTE